MAAKYFFFTIEKVGEKLAFCEKIEKIVFANSTTNIEFLCERRFEGVL